MPRRICSHANELPFPSSSEGLAQMVPEAVVLRLIHQPLHYRSSSVPNLTGYGFVIISTQTGDSLAQTSVH